MATRVFFLLALVSCTSGQSVADLPNCSLSCFQTAVQQTTCKNADYMCQCQPANSNVIESSVTACLGRSTCSLSDIQEIQAFGNTFCPSILAAASASTTLATVAATESSSFLQTASSDVASVSDVAEPQSTASSVAYPSAVAFGANAPGTSWNSIQDADSKANRGPAFEAVSIILLCVAAMIVAFRFFARWYTKSLRNTVKSIGWDDGLAVLALIGTAGITTTIVIGTNHGLGKHLPVTTSVQDLEDILKVGYAFILILIVVLGILKVSILSLYLRMTPTPLHKRICYIVMGFVIAHDFAALFGSIFSCVPVSQYWNYSSHTVFKNPACIDYLPFEIFNSAWSALEDIIIWMLPVPIVWGLKVSVRRKMGLYFLLGVSLISVICAIARLAVTIVWIRSVDISWNYPLIPFLSNIEACVAIITSSVPAIQPLFRGSLRPQRGERAAPPCRPKPSAEEWNGQDSDTAVSSKEDGHSRQRWSLLSHLKRVSSSLRAMSPTSQRHHPTMSRQTGVMTTGPRTELKDLEEDQDIEFVPGLVGEKALRMK